MKRSIQPIFWSLFGAGGMLAALTGPALVFVTGIAIPGGFLLAPELMQYSNMLALASHWAGKLALFAIIVLYLWHAALRIFHLLHDFGIREGPASLLACFGPCLLATLATAYCLIAP